LAAPPPLAAGALEGLLDAARGFVVIGCAALLLLPSTAITSPGSRAASHVHPAGRRQHHRDPPRANIACERKETPVKRSAERILTTHVGSLPRPAALLQAAGGHDGHEPSSGAACHRL